MAFETSTSLIRQLRIALRKEAGIPSYDPDDPALLDHLPSLQEAIAEADPSPPYLRCKQCCGRLLRDIQSLVCVFCGAQQRTEIPPDPIPFKSTIAYRWLLQSLDLTGSEAVSGNVATEGLSTPKDSSVLSDLFDFELKWPSKLEKNESCFADKAQGQSGSSLNLAGVDLDNFFSEAKKETSPSFFDDQSIPDRQILNTETSTFPSQESLSFFKNSQAPDSAARPASTEDVIDESFSGWESAFQSAMSQKHEISSPLDAASGSHMDIKFVNSIDNDAKPKKDSVPPASMAESWFPSDQWHNSGAGVSYEFEQFKNNSEANNNGEPNVNSNDFSSMNDNWIPDELWSTGITKASNTQKSNQDDDSFDAWQDFTSSASAEDPFSGSWKQTGSTTTLSNEHTSKTNLVNNSQEIEFSSVVQPDLFMGPSTLHNGSTDPNSNLDGAKSYREEANSDGIAAAGANSLENSDKALQTESASAAVERLMSQMHDLSFMIGSELSIPQKTDGFDST